MELHVVKGMEKGQEFEPKCCIQMYDTKETFTDFVAIGYNKKTGQTTIMRNTDALTLGMGLRMMYSAFNEAYDKLTDEEKRDVDAILNT